MITFTATPVTIGLQRTAYSVYETDDYKVVCADTLSGDLAGRSIKINYNYNYNWHSTRYDTCM